ALGGIRFFPYASLEEAATDATRLARGMTHKAAMAELGFGGGKSVVMVHPAHKTRALLESFAEAVNRLEGLYICAPDYGCTVEDIQVIREVIRYVVSVPGDQGSGDPSPFTARGTVIGMQTTLQYLFGTPSFKGKKVAIQGLGSVGYKIAEQLFWMGAELVVADPCKEKTQAAKRYFGASVVSTEDILQQDCDIFAPCALGGVINGHTIEKLRCRAIVGCANNQLLDDADAKLLKDKDILYAPDFVVNAGGLMNVSFELNEEGYKPALARNKLDQIAVTLDKIFQLAEENDSSTQAAVMALIEYRLKHRIGQRKQPVCFHEPVGV
ncbi:MAG: Glu/Leu/Phe/Val dehydrogenase, partial [Chlamydiae bacterium]|nr:Glu/Leu/Phe/Val dehydrogenase [Chlamydiota bacterium]